MATISELKDLINCGQGAELGTGSKGCAPVLKATSALWLTKQGFEFDETEEFSEEYITQLQAERKLIILNGVKEFTTNREENVTETDADGTITETRKGLYAFNAMFKKGFNYQAALSSIEGFGNFDISFVDSYGNVLGTTSSTGNLTGVTTGMISADGINFGTYSTAMSQGLTFQFLYREEIDTNYFFISQTVLDWFPQRKDGVNEVVLSFNSIPADGATTIIIDAKLKQGGSAFTGIDYSNFLLKVDGVTTNPTAGDDSVTEGRYVLTVAAKSSNEKLEISLADLDNNLDCITLDGDLYKSNTATETVA